MNKSIQELSGKVSARRRLIRGAFAAPAVLTLHSGSAVAAQSVLCSAKQNNNPVTPVPGVSTSPSDGYVRYQLWALVDGTVVVDDKYYIQGSDFGSMQVAVGFRPTTTEWQEFDIANNTAATTYLGTQPSSGTAQFTRVQQYAILRIDASGAIVGVGDGTSGSATGHSCWCSLNPTAPMCTA